MMSQGKLNENTNSQLSWGETCREYDEPLKGDMGNTG